MKVSSYQMQWRGMNNILDQQSTISNLQSKISLGKNFLQPSDDPHAATKALQLRQHLGRLEQYNHNAESIKSNLEVSEQSLSSYQDILTRVNDLTLQISNDTYSEKDYKAVQKEIEQLLNSALSVANTKDAFGRTIFSGFSQSGAPVELNDTGQYEYKGDLGKRSAFIGDLSSIVQNKNAHEVFFSLDSSQAQVGAPQTFSAHALDQTALMALTGLTVDGQTLGRYDDTLSTFNPTQSALAVENALKAATDLKLQTRVYPASIQLGSYTSGFPTTLTGNELQINAVSINGAVTDIHDFAQLINAQQTSTGVLASVSNDELTLNAIDGRNVEVNYAATTTAIAFSQILNGNAQTHQVYGSVDIYAENDIQISTDNNLTATQAQVASDFTVTTEIVSSQDVTLSSQYLVYGHSDGTVSLYSAAEDRVVVSHSDLSQPIVYEGIRFTISPPPTINSVQSLSVTRDRSSDIFNALSRFSDFLSNPTSKNKRDEVHLMLEAINGGFAKANHAIADIGARINLIDRQVDINKEMVVQSSQTLSTVEDLDLTKAISDFTFQKIAIEAAQSSYVQMQGMFLFKYM